MDCAFIFVGREIDPPVVDNERLFQLGEQQHASAGRIQSGSEQAVIASRVGAGHGPAGKAAQAVGFKPFTAEAGLQISAYAFVKANHVGASPLECRNLVEDFDGFAGCFELVERFWVTYFSSITFARELPVVFFARDEAAALQILKQKLNS